MPIVDLHKLTVANVNHMSRHCLINIYEYKRVDYEETDAFEVLNKA